jgi:hypothetical protein
MNSSRDCSFSSSDGGGKVVRLDLVGKNRQLWAKLQQGLYERIEKLLDLPFDDDRQTTVRDEVKAVSVALLDYAKAKLAMPIFEIQKVEAEIAEKYADRRLKLAEAQKKDAETQALTFRNRVNELRLALGAVQAVLIGEKSKRALLLGQRITRFLEVLKELQATS